MLASIVFSAISSIASVATASSVASSATTASTIVSIASLAAASSAASSAATASSIVATLVGRRVGLCRLVVGDGPEDLFSGLVGRLFLHGLLGRNSLDHLGGVLGRGGLVGLVRGGGVAS